MFVLMDLRKNFYAARCFFRCMIPSNATPPTLVPRVGYHNRGARGGVVFANRAAGSRRQRGDAHAWFEEPISR